MQPPFVLEAPTPFIYNVEVKRVIDGDTLVVDIDLGFHMIMKDQRIRLSGIDTPEIRGKSKWQGLEVKGFVEEALDQVPVIIKSVGKDSFGRILAVVYYENYDTEQWTDLNQELLDKDLAQPYTK